MSQVNLEEKWKRGIQGLNSEIAYIGENLFPSCALQGTKRNDDSRRGTFLNDNSNGEDYCRFLNHSIISFTPDFTSILSFAAICLQTEVREALDFAEYIIFVVKGRYCTSEQETTGQSCSAITCQFMILYMRIKGYLLS